MAAGRGQAARAEAPSGPPAGGGELTPGRVSTSLHCINSLCDYAYTLFCNMHIPFLQTILESAYAFM